MPPAIGFLFTLELFTTRIETFPEGGFPITALAYWVSWKVLPSAIACAVKVLNAMVSRKTLEDTAEALANPGWAGKWPDVFISVFERVFLHRPFSFGFIVRPFWRLFLSSFSFFVCFSW